MKFFLLVLFSLLVSNSSFSQKIKAPPKTPAPDYITKEASKWSLRVYSATKYDQFNLVGKSFNAAFKPDVKLSGGIGASYKNLTLDLAANLFSSDRAHKSKNVALLSSMYSHAHLVELTIQVYRHYTAQVYNAQHEQLFSLFRRDIHTFNFGLNYNYNFNRTRFSFDACFIGTQIQKRSAGAPIGGAYFSYIDIASDSSLISPSLFEELSITESISDAKLFTGGISAGYAYTLVLPFHFYIMAAATPKLGLQAAEIKKDNYHTVPLNFTTGVLMRSAIGYAGKKYYSFFSVLTDYNSIYIEPGNSISYDPVKVKLLFGFRFK